LGGVTVVEAIGGDAPQSSYDRALRALCDDGVPFLVGGAVVLAAYCGIQRMTKDLDLFVLQKDAGRVLEVLTRVGMRTELPFPHWLGKAYDGDQPLIDVIFSSGNGAAPVDHEWFAHGRLTTLRGLPVRLCPAEETLWTKAYVMERERYDGADVAHLLLACAEQLDWERLLRRFGDTWHVLLSHLVLFGFVYPGEMRRIPPWVLDELLSRLGREREAEPRDAPCRGTLLSREQYLPDLEWGRRDARLAPEGRMSAEEIAIWTRAIARR
jgi:hypothetical protein